MGGKKRANMLGEEGAQHEKHGTRRKVKRRKLFKVL
jgi:hypothetical protein